jgi:hypothetical protein
MIPNGVSVLRSRAPVNPMHDEEAGLIEEKKVGFFTYLSLHV